MTKKSRPTIIFHIGFEKTGTTSFQAFCTNNRALLLQQSVLYPVYNYGFSRGSHEPLASSYFPKNAARQLMMRSSNRDRGAVLRSLFGEIEAVSADTVLISAEHFSSRFSASHIRELAADFSNYNCQIAVVVRDHVSRALSAYSTSIASGRYLTLDDFVNEICHVANNYIRYKETIIQWESVFGNGNINVIPYNNNIVEVLAKHLISSHTHFNIIGRYEKNKSFGASTIESRRLANEILSKHRSRFKSIFHPLSVATRIRSAFKQNAIENLEDRLRFNEEQLRRVNAIAEIDRLWLENHYHVQLENS
jgi:hypothetical protein